MKNIYISVLIANYNGEKYINRCLKSCINQKTKKNYEIIFIDDNSTDHSLDKAKKYNNKVKIISTDKSQNISRFNTFYQLNTYFTGYKKAKGKIICFLDSDDFFKKNKLKEIELNFLKKKNLKFIFDLPILINSKGNIKNTSYKYGFRDGKWPKFPPQSCMSVKRNIIDKNIKKLFKKKFHLTTLDFRIASLADLNKKNSLFLNKKLTFYFQHFGNETNKNFKKFNLNWFKRRLEAFKYYKLVNKKKLKSFDYLFTIIIFYFFESLSFCKSKIKKHLSKITLH